MKDGQKFIIQGGWHERSKNLPGRHAVSRQDRAHHRRVGVGLAAAAACQTRFAEYSGGAVRRRWLCASGLFWLRHQHAEHQPSGDGGAALPRFSYHGDLCADPRLPADRPEPSYERSWHHSRTRRRFPRLQRHAAERMRHVAGNPGESRLRDLRHRQVASGADQRICVRRGQGALAALARVRALLRFSRRQDQPVGADPGA